MIKANHKKWARWTMTCYLNRILRKNFSHFFLVNEPPAFDGQRGVLITPNHISWWDGFIIDFINRTFFKKKLHIMMLEQQLKRYRFFSKVGAFSIQPGNKQETTKSLDYTRELLSDPANLVVMYPQGVLEVAGTTPVKIKPGVQRLCQTSHFQFTIVPFAVTLSFYDQRKPDIFCRFSTAISSTHIKKDLSSLTKPFLKNIHNVYKASHNRIYKDDLFSWKK